MTLLGCLTWSDKMTILNQTVELIKEGYTWGFNLSFSSIFLLIIGIGMIALGIYITPNNSKNIGVIVVLLILFSIGIGSLVSAFHTKPVYKEVSQYEVLLDETIPFHEIYDKYDIIEQRGQIFVLRDKE